MYANSKGSGETAQMRRIAWSFAGRLCDQYHNLMSWLIFESAFYAIYRAVALGLTADDMMAVQEFTEGLKTKKQPESVATIIKREVAMEESHMKVSERKLR